MIKAEHLSKSYGPFQAIADVSFEVNKGEIVGFLGVNGAGKTTTMRILTGYYTPTSGRAWIAGHSLSENPGDVKKAIGYLPETPPLYLDMDVEGYLKFVMELKGLSKPQRAENLQWVMSKCGLTERRRSIIRNLSKGFRQRVGLAQAIIHKPPVIILDEPTVGLDPVQIIEIRNLIKSLAGSHTVLLSTHILSEVTATCERVIMIHRGRIVNDLRIQDLSQKKSLEELFMEVVTKDEAALSTVHRKNTSVA